MKWAVSFSRISLYAILAAWATSAFAGVTVSAPKSGAHVATTVQFLATASTTCKKGVGAMGIYTKPNKLVYSHSGAKLNKIMTLASGSYNIVIQEWDQCGGTAKKTVPITVGSGGGSTPPPSEGNSDPPSGSHVFANLQKDSHWNAYALLRSENYHLCDHCSPSGSKINWSTKQGISSPSVSGSAMKFSVGGDQAYNDMFWNNKFTSRLPDSDHLEKYHEFTYDVYFFGTSLEKSQALEFDINQFYNNRRFIWGHECRIAGGHEWDSWDNNSEHWVKTGIPCNPKSNAWNHLIIKAKRIDDTTMEFVSITLNGKTWNENRKDTVLKRDGWHGITINYQMDLNKHADDYTVYLDKLNFYYK